MARPYPVPERPWVLRMTWLDLLFAHRRVPAETLVPHLPAGLTLDLYEGEAWLGTVPFRMAGIRPRFLPAVPWLSAFPELNLRTYVTDGERPGVWFFSLDAANPLAVRLARGGFHLPYFDARMSVEQAGERVVYRSERTHRGAPAGTFYGRYRPSGPVFRAEPGSLDAWLTERYCFYSADRRGHLYRGEIDHEPWPLQPAEAVVEEDTLAEGLGVAPAGEPTHLLFARRLDVVAWLLHRAAPPST